MPEEDTRPKLVKPSNYPGNSHKARENNRAPREERIIQKVTTSAVVQRKKSLARKIAETFTGDDIQSVGDYVIFDVMIPAAKAMFADATSQGVERLMFGESRSRPRRGGSSRPGYTRYDRMRDEVEKPREISQRGRAAHDFDEVVLKTRTEAEEVLDRLTDLIELYDVATVSDLYELVGITGNFTDDKWGWTDLRQASVTQIRGGYLLNLPKTKPID